MRPPHRHAIVALFLVFTQVSCRDSQRDLVTLTPNDVRDYGTRTIHAPHAVVVNAAVDTLVGQGFEVADRDPTTHQIRTARRALVTFRMTKYSTMWILTLSDTPDGVRVIAEPFLFDGDRDISGKSVWELEDARGKWAELFEGIESECRVLQRGR